MIPNFLKNLFIYLFIYFWLHWVFVAARGLSLVAESRGYSSLQCAGFSLWWLLLLRSTGSRARSLQQLRYAGFSSGGVWAQLLCGMWDLPGPGIEPVCPALTGGFLTTAPPGKTPHLPFVCCNELRKKKKTISLDNSPCCHTDFSIFVLHFLLFLKEREPSCIVTYQQITFTPGPEEQ